MLAICECKREILAFCFFQFALNFTLRASWRCNLASLLWFCLKLLTGSNTVPSDSVTSLLIPASRPTADVNGYPPTVQLSKLVNSLKAVTSRRLRNEFLDLREAYNKPVLWSRSYFVGSCGGAPLEVVKRYIQHQRG